MGRRVLLFSILFTSAPAAPQEPIPKADIAKLDAEAARLIAQANELHQQGKTNDAIVKVRQAVAVRRQQYPASTHPNGHPDLAKCLSYLGELYEAAKAYPEALLHFEQALATYQKLYPPASHPEGHSSIADILHNLGSVHQQMRAYQKALPYCEQALAMRRKLYEAKFPEGHPEIARTLNLTAFVLEELGSHFDALTYREQALAIRLKLYPESRYPDGHADVAASHSNLAFTLYTLGLFDRALPHLEQTLAIRRRLYPAAKCPDGHPQLATSLNWVAVVQQAMGALEKALPYAEQALAMRQKLYPASKHPDGHPDTARSLISLGFMYMSEGAFEKALPYCEQALAMFEKLYPAARFPDGHPNIASTLNILGKLWNDGGAADRALPYYERALAVRQKLYPVSSYPNVHPDLAISLNNLGNLMQKSGAFEKALPLWKQALAMRQQLYPAAKYPNGHPQLAYSLHNLGFLLSNMGDADGAIIHYNQALAMMEKLYPESRYPGGHPDLALCLNNIGFHYDALGDQAKALPYREKAQTLNGRVAARFLASASESEALAFVQAQPLMRDALLSCARHIPGTTATAYGAVWTGKAAVTRVLEQRYAAARLAGTANAGKLDRLRGLRRRVDTLLQDTRLAPAERDKLLAAATDERDLLERELAGALPALGRAKERDALGPGDLESALPKDAVFIDIVQYCRFDFVRTRPGQTHERRTQWYAAFVLARGRTMQRVELGEAAYIDRAIAQWRRQIEERTDHGAAEGLRDLIWNKLVPHLSPTTTTIYLTADGDLARLPWGALPVGMDRVLLENYAVALVPHGAFLLDHLRFPRRGAGKESVLTLGGVDYGDSPWPVLPGTIAETKAIAALAPGRIDALAMADATRARLTERLSQARFAHLATHGEFKAHELIQERKRAGAALASRQFGDESRNVATKNPLGFVGLVLAGGEIMSGLSILDLNLDNLNLVTLSACETGLGDLTGGEGVQGLQRAFHLAGCPNVIASLWKVNDAATAALMAKFYDELWTKKKTPIEALREAQLTIYRHPELIKDLAGERGAPKVKEALHVKSTDPKLGVVDGRTDTKFWAAFVLSGLGK